MDQVMNMGFHNISDGIPIDLESYGKQGKNKK